MVLYVNIAPARSFVLEEVNILLKQGYDTSISPLRRAYTYDKQGNMLSDGEHTYTYDAMNRLTEVNTADGNKQRNIYDAEGLRAEMEENDRLVTFLYDGEKVVTETDCDQNTIRYIRGYELISSDSEKAKTYYHYVSDEMGSITHITDESGTVCNRYEYDAFGDFTVREENVQNRFAYTGEQYDPLTGLYYLRSRFYNPVIGRFIQEDTYYGDGLNLYTYCQNNPVKYVDPSGFASDFCDAKQQAINTIAEKNGLSLEDAETQYDKLRNSGKYKNMTPEEIRNILTGESCPDGRIAMAGKRHPVTGVLFDSKGYPIFDSLFDMNLLPEDYIKTRGTHFSRASKALYNAIQNDSKLKSLFTDVEIEQFKQGDVPSRFTWHHNQSSGKMQLVDFAIHDATYHKGGFSFWGPGNKKTTKKRR